MRVNLCHLSIRWGADCHDCGPRHRATLSLENLSSEIAYGQPSQSEFKAAQSFLCSYDGYNCQLALSESYKQFHGERNVYSSIIQSVCLESVCTLQGIFNYNIPATADLTCCLAAQIAAGYLLQTHYDYNITDLGYFGGLCAQDIIIASVLDLFCVEETNHSGIPFPFKN